MSTNSVIVDWPVGNATNPARLHFEIPRDGRSDVRWFAAVNDEIVENWTLHPPIMEIGQKVHVSWEGANPFVIELGFWPDPPGASVYWLQLVQQTIENNWQTWPPV